MDWLAGALLIATQMTAVPPQSAMPPHTMSSRTEPSHMGAMTTAAAPCPADAAALPADLAGWGALVPASAGASIATTPPMLALGRSASVTLVAAPMLQFAARTPRVAGATGYGGLFTFTAAQAGRYRVALGSGAWIDVVAAGTALASVAHAKGPACSGIVKMVDFDLKPGTYVLQIANNRTASVPVMVTLAGAPAPVASAATPPAQ